MNTPTMGQKGLDCQVLTGSGWRGLLAVDGNTEDWRVWLPLPEAAVPP